MIALVLALIYTGPLTDRQIIHAPVNGQGVIMMFVVEDGGLSQRLYANGPIAVLKPGSNHLGYGLEGSPTGTISLFRFNLRLERAAHWSRLGNALWHEGPHNGLFPNLGEALAWGLEAMRTLGHEPTGHVPSMSGARKTWPQLVTEWRQKPDFDPAREAEVLARWAKSDAARLDALTTPLLESGSIDATPIYMPWPDLRLMNRGAAIAAEGPHAARIASLAERWLAAPVFKLDPQTDGAGFGLTGVRSPDGRWFVVPTRFNLHALAQAKKIAATNRPLGDPWRAMQMAILSTRGNADWMRYNRWIADELALEGVDEIPVSTEFSVAGLGGPYRIATRFMDHARAASARGAYFEAGGYDAAAFEKKLAEVRALP